MRTVRALPMLVSALVLAACAGAAPATTAAPTATAAPTTAAPTDAPTAAAAGVRIASFRFSPAELVVQPGTTVTWTNFDATSHTVKWDGGPESPVLRRGSRYERRFEAPGTFEYVCGIHPNMRGTVRVEG